jgi:hypothetical protein
VEYQTGHIVSNFRDFSLISVELTGRGGSGWASVGIGIGIGIEDSHQRGPNVKRAGATSRYRY